MIASLVTPDKDFRKQILEKKVVLKKENTEKTVLRFKLDNNLKLVPGSVNSLRKKFSREILIMNVLNWYYVI